MRDNRICGFAVISSVYLAAGLLALWMFSALHTPFWLSVLAADVGATVFVFLFSVLLDNASVYDPYWSVQPMLFCAALAIGTHMTLYRLLMFAVVLLWGIRLTANWAYTFPSLSHQDWRYTMLHEKTGKAYPLINFLGIHLVPTLVVYGCMLPIGYAMLYEAKPTALSYICLAISFAAVCLQGISDIQMHAFRQEKQSGKTNEVFIRRGFWKHSRHPNYLAEILMWWGIGGAVVTAIPSLWYLLGGAFANHCLFLFVSIPLAEGKQSKKDGYDLYKQETRALLPLPKFHSK